MTSITRNSPCEYLINFWNFKKLKILQTKMLAELLTEIKLQECRHAASWTFSLQPDEDAFSRGAPKRHAKETRDVAAGRRNGEG